MEKFVINRVKSIYVYVEVALHGVPMERGVQPGLGEGPIMWVQCPNPTGTIGPVLRRLAHTYAFSGSNFNLDI